MNTSIDYKSQIYTKKGDTGQTSLYQGPRVSKSHPRVQAYGGVDELNSTIGVAKHFVSHPDVRKLLERIQHKLMNVASILATPSYTPDEKAPKIIEADITGLENCIDYFDQKLPPITMFILPGQTKSGAFIDLSRVTCRRAERLVISLYDIEPVDPILIKFLNRLSDLLFVLERTEHHYTKTPEKFWQK